MNIKKEEQWLAVSCLQNAVRRGHTDLAVEYTQALLNVNPFYAQYRLSVIAVEDIGVADVDTITPFLNTALKKANIKAMGGDDFVLKTAQKLALANKDRTACDIGSLAKQTSFPETVNPQDPISIKKHVLSEDSSFEEKALGLWLLTDAKRLKHPLYNNIEGGLKHFIYIQRQWEVPDAFIETMIACKNYHSEPIWPHLGLCYRAKQEFLKTNNLKECKVINKKYDIQLVDEKWLIEGLDKHTQEGKAAIGKILYKNKKIQSILNSHSIPQEDRVGLIGNSLFRLDGQAVDKRINYPLAVSIYKKATNNHYGEAKKDLIKFFNNNWDNWTQFLTQTYFELKQKKQHKKNASPS